jgi:hypothetical protein
LQAKQDAQDAALQHTPSTQLPFAQSAPVLQELPDPLPGTHFLLTQLASIAQSLSEVQDKLHPLFATHA